MQRRKWLLPVAVLAIGLLSGCMPVEWAPAIAGFEKQDQLTPPPKHPILFVGSSTIRFWKTSEAFPNLPVLNRGFGGSQTSDVLYYFDRVIARYHPSTIVFYSGDNDLAAGKPVDRVVDDTHELIDRIRKRLPDTRLIFIAIKPSIARWNLIDKMREANREIQKIVEARPSDVFLDIGPKLLDANGKPDPALFRKDGLHLNERGYAILNDAVRPHLTR